MVAPRLPTAASRWNYYERRMMHRGGDPRRVAPDTTDVDCRFLPEARQAAFTLDAYWIDERFVRIYSGCVSGSHLESCFFSTRGARRYVLFLIHPASRHLYCEFLQSSGARVAYPSGHGLWASPTSSTRTVLVWGEHWKAPPFFAKLSLAASIGEVERTLTPETMTRSIGVSRIIDAARHELPANFKFLRETLSISPRPRGFGFIVRPIPEEVLRNEVDFVPIFSLYSRQADRIPWLARLISASRMNAHDFIAEHLIVPFAQQWTRLVVEQGFIPEPHAQNLLVEINRGGRMTGTFIHRDMEAFFIDLGHRHKARKHVPKHLPRVTPLRQNYSQFRLLKRAVNSVHRHFQGTVLYQINQLLYDWHYEGFFGNQRPARHSLEWTFSRELERSLGIYTRGPIQLRESSYAQDLKQSIQRARRGFLSA